jgi:hypothetical protein
MDTVLTTAARLIRFAAFHCPSSTASPPSRGSTNESITLIVCRPRAVWSLSPAVAPLRVAAVAPRLAMLTFSASAASPSNSRKSTDSPASTNAVRYASAATPIAPAAAMRRRDVESAAGIVSAANSGISRNRAAAILAIGRM